jgi:hypothetical protein
MKKLLLPLLLSAFSSRSQRFYDNTPSVNRPYLENESEAWVMRSDPSKKIKTIEWKGKKETDKSFMLLDELGYLQEIKYVANARGFLFFEPLKHFHKKFYYTNKLCTNVEFYNKKNVLGLSVQYEFFTPTQVAHTKEYKNNKLVFEGIKKFNSDSTAAEYKALKYKNGVAKMSIRYEHDYYSDKQRKETRQYNKKNKLKQVWKYDCDPKGEVKVKKTNQVCRNVGSDNKGRELEILFNTDHTGKKTKTIYTFYTVNGKRINVNSEFFIIKKGKEIKWYEQHYPDSIESWYGYKKYDEKGVLVFEQKKEYSQFNSGGIVVRSESLIYYRNGKISTKTLRTHNEKGRILKNEYFNRKQISLGKREWTYTGDTLVTTKDYSKKGKLRSTQTCHISYY